VNKDRHDTIGMLVRDAAGGLAGACSTSGLAFKLHGRVGDSPIIGAGLYVDNSVGAACTTGLGELAMKTLSSFLTVEKMREGATPQEACEAAVARILSTYPMARADQLCCLALSGDGAVGAFSILPGFQYAVADPSGNVLQDAPSRLP
jgi:N4-(beta-N-acetylglucosaminyl)-L-asparaginase